MTGTPWKDLATSDRPFLLKHEAFIAESETLLADFNIRHPEGFNPSDVATMQRRLDKLAKQHGLPSGTVSLAVNPPT